MRICLFSNNFFPPVGGIQQVSDTLARAWVRAGHEVRLATPQAAEAGFDSQFPYPVIRIGTTGTWADADSNADIVVSNGYCLRPFGRWLMKRKRVVFIHPLFLTDEPGRVRSVSRNFNLHVSRIYRRSLLPLAKHIFVSEYIRQDIGGVGPVIANPVAPEFRIKPEIPPGDAMAFFGRMVEEKGVGTLLRALAVCRRRGASLPMDLYGDGHHLADFKKLASELNLADQLRWHPFLRGEELVDAMNRAKAIVVPSDWPEPFGIVAIEAMSCGKCVIASNGGGLGELMRYIGPTYENHNADQLAEHLLAVHNDPSLLKKHEQIAIAKAKEFQPDKIAGMFITHFEEWAGR
jgi:glycogen synthase